MLEKEFKYYLDHQDELVKLYDGQYIVIKNDEVLGSFCDIQDAITETEKLHPRGTFLVQLVEAGQESYTQHFFSRVTFA